ncbi:36820_t:CDS:2, partial [Gigaspora margarita]
PLTPTIDQPNTSKSPIAQTILLTLSSFHTLETTATSVPIAHSRLNMMEIDDDPVFNTPIRETISATQPTKRPLMADQETNTPE